MKHLQKECHSLQESDISEIVKKTEGYSVSDLWNLSQEAAMEPVKSLSPDAILRLQPSKVNILKLSGCPFKFLPDLVFILHQLKEKTLKGQPNVIIIIIAYK